MVKLNGILEPITRRTKMNTENKYEQQITPVGELRRLVQITAGLLASGHYVRDYNPGSLESAERQGYDSAVIDVARNILVDVREQVNWRVFESPGDFILPEEVATK
jgi:hypothetical protein